MIGGVTIPVQDELKSSTVFVNNVISVPPEGLQNTVYTC